MFIFCFPGDYTLWSTLTQHKCFSHSHPGPFKILKLKIIYKFDIDEFLINQLQHNCSQFS